MENKEPKLVCRKCQGQHLTMNCGKEKKSVIDSKISEYDKEDNIFHDNIGKGDNNSLRNNPDSNFKGISKGNGKGNGKCNGKGNGKGYNNRFNDNSDSNFKDFKHERRPLHKVKISNLPIDMQEEELYELLYEWGHVVKLRLLNYDSNSIAYIEFKEIEAADYFVKALDKTPFDHLMLDVERLYD